MLSIALGPYINRPTTIEDFFFYIRGEEKIDNQRHFWLINLVIFLIKYIIQYIITKYTQYLIKFAISLHNYNNT